MIIEIYIKTEKKEGKENERKRIKNVSFVVKKETKRKKNTETKKRRKDNN